MRGLFREETPRRARRKTVRWSRPRAALRIGEFGINRQGQGLFCGGFALGEIARAVAEIRKTLLPMQRDGVVDFRAYVLPLQMLEQRITTVDAEDELVVNVAVARHFIGELYQPIVGKTGRLEHAPITGGVRLPAGRPLVEVAQLDGDDRGLERIETEVAAEDGVIVFRFGTVHAKDAQFLGYGGVAGGDQAAIAGRARFFEGKKLKQP